MNLEAYFDELLLEKAADKAILIPDPASSSCRGQRLDILPRYHKMEHSKQNPSFESLDERQSVAPMVPARKVSSDKLLRIRENSVTIPNGRKGLENHWCSELPLPSKSKQRSNSSFKEFDISLFDSAHRVQSRKDEAKRNRKLFDKIFSEVDGMFFQSQSQGWRRAEFQGTLVNSIFSFTTTTWCPLYP